jgi:2,4-dienoyl-CoA reductase-like NADH-dependent reductase (Old Yellow Enzyme family)
MSGATGVSGRKKTSPRLFEPLRLGGVTVANRIVVSARCQYSAREGLPNDWHLQDCGSLPSSGPGLLMIEATAVAPEGRITTGCLGLCSDAHEAALARLIEAIRTVGDVRIAHPADPRGTQGIGDATLERRASARA